MSFHRSTRSRPRCALLRSPLAALAFGVCFFASGAAAAGPEPAYAPSPFPVPPGSVGVVHVILDEGPAQGPSCLSVYNDVENFTGLYYAEQDGKRVADDLHMVEGGSLCSFTFGYNDPGPGGFQAVVTFFANDGSDSPPTIPVGGPYTVGGLPGGTNAIIVDPPDAPVLGQDVWMAVQFSAPTPGLLIADPPVVGSSHDYFYEQPPGDYFFFGGSPRANFYLRVEAEPAVPAEISSWGLLKTRHR